MKKVMFIMAAALLMMTQCKKENETPNDPAEGTVKMTVTAGPGRTGINTTDGSITWSAGDKLYVSDGTNWLGSLTLVGNGGSAQGTFTGNIVGIGESETTCHFFYLGHDNSMTELTGSTAANISFAAQDGTLAGAMKYHLGYGNTTNVTVTDDEAIGSVIMNTKIAIAHLNLITAGSQAYTGSVTMEGTGICNVMTVNPNGTFSGSGTDGITIGATTTGEKYVTLIPTTGTDRVDVAFTGDAAGSMTFLAGIHENKFYGMKDAIAVTLHEYVDLGLPSGMLWATCNIGANSPEEYGDYFMWGSIIPNTNDNCCWANAPFNNGRSYYNSTYFRSVRSTVCPGGILASEYDAAANWGDGWRMPTVAEWQELKDNNTFRWLNAGDTDGATGFTAVAAGYLVVKGGKNNIAIDNGVYMFLPAAGYRDASSFYYGVPKGYYWSSSLYLDLPEDAYHMSFGSNYVSPQENIMRYHGFAVRPVR